MSEVPDCPHCHRPQGKMRLQVTATTIYRTPDADIRYSENITYQFPTPASDTRPYDIQLVNYECICGYCGVAYDPRSFGWSIDLTKSSYLYLKKDEDKMEEKL